MDVIDQRRRDLGGFEVGRVLPFTRRHMVGPFIFFDHIGPVTFLAGVFRGPSTYARIRTSASPRSPICSPARSCIATAWACMQAIQPDEVNWMIAGRGITHSERFEKARAEGGPLHGIQAWVALPNEHEETDPSFAHYGASALPVHEDGGLRTRLLAGKAFGLDSGRQDPLAACSTPTGKSPRERASRCPRNSPSARCTSPPAKSKRAARCHGAGRMLVFDKGEDSTITASARSTLMALGGEPVGERFIEWNFVSSSRERIEQAKADWRAGRMKLPDFDNQEFIPLA